MGNYSSFYILVMKFVILLGKRTFCIQATTEYYFASWTVHHATRLENAHPQYFIDSSSIEHLSEGTRNAPWRWQCNAETCRSYRT
jgi:hypothetical protein